MSEEVIEQTFPVSGEAVFSLSNIRGTVVVKAGSPVEITVKAAKRRSSGDAGRTEIIMEQAQDGSVKVETRFQNSFLNIVMLSFPCEVDYMVSVPPTCDIHLSGVSAALSLEGVKGRLELSTVSGDIQLVGLSGSLDLNSVSGGISGAQLAGEMKLKTVSGDVRLDSSQLSTIEANTVSGDIHLQSPIGSGPYNFHSVSGNVVLDVPDDTACRVDLSTVSGDVHTKLPGAKHGKQRGHAWAEVGSGGAQITANSISGDVRMSSPGGAAAQDAPAAKPAGRSAEERMQILARIERGEISADEALHELQAQ
jgi:DUF4097 and DUF4098 domain-containing protein YvlB